MFQAELFGLKQELEEAGISQEGTLAALRHKHNGMMAEMGEPFSGMEVASFMSCSKGYMGECGMRCQLNTLG